MYEEKHLILHSNGFHVQVAGNVLEVLENLMERLKSESYLPNLKYIFLYNNSKELHKNTLIE